MIRELIESTDPGKCLGIVGLLLFAQIAVWSCSPTSTGATETGRLPNPDRDLVMNAGSNETSTAVFAGGCFWCTEAVFEQLDGVVDVVSGYAGGNADNADYNAVSSGKTRHAEAVKVTYTPSKISYGKLLQVFFTTHDPTQLNRQGPDVGFQYRSAVFFADGEQKQVAEAYLGQLARSGGFSEPIVTTLEPLGRFYPAEPYHQNFVARNPNHPYVRAWVPAKLEKLKKYFPELLNASGKSAHSH